MIRNLDFTYDPVNYAGLPSFVRQLQRDGMRYIIILVRIGLVNNTIILLLILTFNIIILVRISLVTSSQ